MVVSSDVFSLLLQSLTSSLLKSCTVLQDNQPLNTTEGDSGQILIQTNGSFEEAMYAYPLPERTPNNF